MKSFHFYIKLVLLLLVFLNFQKSLFAENYSDIDLKVKNLTSKLRCMTCQNQSIYDSDAEFSQDIKKLVKKMFIEGKSQKEIMEFITLRYGEYILFEPKLDKKNIFLWSFPFIALFLSVIFFFIKVKKT